MIFPRAIRRLESLKTPFLACLLIAAFADGAVAGDKGSQSFVRVSATDPRYFEMSDGRAYVPIGLNMIAPPGQQAWPVMKDWMEKLSAQGGNFIRVWLGNPYFDVEHSRCGEYDTAKAQRIDELLATAATLGIKVKMCMEHFRHLGEGRQAWAAKPLHLVQNGGTATNIADFFNGEKSRAQFKKKLAWYQNRFGNHSQVFGWELWNEINAVSGGDYMAWTEAMLPELHRLFPSNLCMQSLGSFDTDRVRANYRRLALMKGNDVAQVHRYLDLGASLEVCKGPVDVLAADAVREMLAAKPGKPVLLAESGAVEPRHSGPFKLYAKDTNGVILHDVLFAPFFAGAAGPGHIWHWDAYVAKNNLWWHFGRFAEAIRDMVPASEHFEPAFLQTESFRIYGLKGKRMVVLWIRDIPSDWRAELEQGRPAELISGKGIELANWWDKAQPVKARIYDPWQNKWSDAAADDGMVKLPPFRRSLVVRLLPQ